MYNQVLKEEFQSLPEQAIQCSLYEAKPVDDSAWSDEAITAFSDLVTEKDAVIRVIEKSASGGYVVEILDASNSTDLALNALVKGGFAKDPSSIQGIL